MENIITLYNFDKSFISNRKTPVKAVSVTYSTSYSIDIPIYFPSAILKIFAMILKASIETR